MISHHHEAAEVVGINGNLKAAIVVVVWYTGRDKEVHPIFKGPSFIYYQT